MENFKALDMKSGDEVENLNNSITKTMVDMNDHITSIKEQAKHISDMQHNIILTMADIESCTNFPYYSVQNALLYISHSKKLNII